MMHAQCSLVKYHINSRDWKNYVFNCDSTLINADTATSTPVGSFELPYFFEKSPPSNSSHTFGSSEQNKCRPRIVPKCPAKRIVAAVSDQRNTVLVLMLQQ